MSMTAKPVSSLRPDLRTALIAMVRKRVPESEVEDIVQQALAEAIESPHAPQESEALRRWIFGVAKNKVVDYHRRAGREELRAARCRGHARAACRGGFASLGREEPPRRRREPEDARLDAPRRRGREARVDCRIGEAPAAARSPAREPPAPSLQGELAARSRAARRARCHRERDRRVHPEEARARADHA